MNKELIKKYKAEFDHWLNGGTLLYRHFDYKKQEFNLWEVCDEGFLWNVRPIKHPCIIINDEYVEFRQALAEGKTVEVAIDHNDIDGYIWKSVEDDEFHHFNIDEIRIKPENQNRKDQDGNKNTKKFIRSSK